MYTLYIRWHPYTGIQQSDQNLRYQSMKSPIMSDKFKDMVDAGLVSNTPSANCYIREIDDTIEICNATWQTQEAAQECINFIKDLPAVVGFKMTDESGTILAGESF